MRTEFNGILFSLLIPTNKVTKVLYFQWLLLWGGRRHRGGRVDGFIQLLNNINNKYCLNTTNNLLIEQTMNTIQTFHAMNEQSEKYEGAFSRWNDFLSKNLIVLNIPLNLRNSKKQLLLSEWYICAHNMLDCLFWMNGLAQVGPARNQEP